MDKKTAQQLIQQVIPNFTVSQCQNQRSDEVCPISSILLCTILMNHRLGSRNKEGMVHSDLEKRLGV